MPCNKNLYSSENYRLWIKEASKDFNTAREALEYEMLMKDRITEVNCIRLLFCCYKLKDYQLINDILNLMSTLYDDHPFKICCKISLMIYNNVNSSYIFQYIKDSKKKLKEKKLEQLYTELVNLYMDCGKIEDAYFEINEALRFFPDSQIFNILFSFSHITDKRSFLESLIEKKDKNQLIYIQKRAYIEYINLNRLELNYANAIQSIQKASTQYELGYDFTVEKALLFTDMGKYFEAYKLYKCLSNSIYLNNPDVLNGYAYILRKLDLRFEMYGLLKECINNLTKKHNAVLQFLDFLHQDGNQMLKNDSLSLSLSLSNLLYNIHYRNGNSNNILYIFISHNTEFICYKNKLKGNALFISDNYYSWYILYPSIIINAIKKYIDSETKIFIIGASRGGFGSLLLGNLMGSMCNNEVFILSFSPQTVLFPFNENVVHVSPMYLNFYKKVSEFSVYHDYVKKFGNINNLFLTKKSNVNTFIFVGEKMTYDMNEISIISQLNTCFICQIPNFSSHYSLMYFYKDKEWFEEKLAHLNTNDKMYKEYKYIYSYKLKYNYSFIDIIQSVLDKNCIFCM